MPLIGPSSPFAHTYLHPPPTHTQPTPICTYTHAHMHVRAHTLHTGGRSTWLGCHAVGGCLLLLLTLRVRVLYFPHALFLRILSALGWSRQRCWAHVLLPHQCLWCADICTCRQVHTDSVRSLLSPCAPTPPPCIGYSDLFKRCPELMYQALTLHNNVIRKVCYNITAAALHGAPARLL
jgi:hypothetical protein